MLHWIIILGLLGYLQGCGSPLSTQIDEDVRSSVVMNAVFDTTYIHPDFVDTVEQFEADCPAAQLSNVRSINYANVRDSDHPDRVGVCYFGDEVQIHTEVAGLHPALQRAIMYHELGHCLLELDTHVGMMEGMHIMNPFIYLDDPQYYERNWDALVTKMCN